VRGTWFRNGWKTKDIQERNYWQWWGIIHGYRGNHTRFLKLQKQKDTLLGAQIEEFLSHMVSSNTTMSFMGTYFGPSLRHQGTLYWNYLVGRKNVNYAKKANNVKDIVKHILYIPWFTG
jgi:hypothetical protein